MLVLVGLSAPSLYSQGDNNICPDDHHPHMIDLGLPSGTQWACCNVDANSPEEYGGYYAWGETETKDCYEWETYTYYNDNDGVIFIGDDIAGTQYDVAHVKWGSFWKLPKIDQYKELIDYCTTTDATQNGKRGLIFTGPNGATIFLPAAGGRIGYEMGDSGVNCWSSTANRGAGSDKAYYYSDLQGWNGYTFRRTGYPVRPVYSIDLSISQNHVIITIGNSTTIDITEGNGNYEISSSNSEIVKAKINCSTITLTAQGLGSAVVTIKDTFNNQTVDIAVSVRSAVSYIPAEAIDLGLPSGTLWASWNIGATKPEEYGGYYSWGETEVKDVYDWSNYTHCEGTSESCSNIGDNIAGTEYDVAHMKWGGSWLMPSRTQIDELIKYCSHEWTSENGVIGDKFISKKNGNSIFLPAAGFYWDEDLVSLSEYSYYWSDSQSPDRETHAYGLKSNEDNTSTPRHKRMYGFPIRPICLTKPIPNLSISQDSVELNVGNTAFIEITSGSGNYEITNSNTNVIEATLDGTTITLKGLSEGSAVVIVKDVSSNQTADISVTVVPALPPSEYSVETKPFYIYRNDGDFNVFFHNMVDSILYSNYDADSIYHADIVSQVVYAADSVYFIPLAAIDSISFITPETVYKPGIRVLDEEFKSYVLSVDSLTIRVSNTITSDLLPRQGDKIVTTVMDDIFPVGFAGEVVDVTSTNSETAIICQPVALEEIFEVYYGFTQPIIEGNRARQILESNQHLPGSYKVFAPGKLSVSLSNIAGFANSYLKNDELSFDLNEFNAEISVTPVIRGMGSLVITPEIGTNISLFIEGRYQLEENFGLKGGFTWSKDNSLLTFLPKGRLFWPILPLADVYLDVGWFLRASCELGIQQSWTQEYHNTFYWEWSSKQEEMIKPVNDIRKVSSDHSGQVAINGQLGAGLYGEVGVDFVHTKNADIANLHLRYELGANIEGSFVLYNEDMEEASKSTALYEQLRDTEVGINWYRGFLFEGNFWKWGFSKPLPNYWNIPFSDAGRIITFTLAPYFSDTKARLAAHTLNAECMISGPQSLAGNYNIPVNAGFWVKDNDGNDIAKKMVLEDYHGGKKKTMNTSIFDMPADESLTVYPYIRWMGHDILASPSYKVGLPVKIIEFKQTDSHYEKDGFRYNDDVYSYQYDVTVTVELLEADSVSDWGYVYENPWGEKAHISLKDFSSPYPDSRYVYYRNESKSTVRLYEYVKFEGREEYEYGEPVDYEIHHGFTTCPDDNHPHMIDMGLPSGTKWACCNVGASKPEEYGGYYAWGETKEKSYYDLSSYKYYTSEVSECIYIGDDIAGTEYDVAHVKWGDSWRMPSVDQIKELLENSTSTYPSLNGVVGIRVTGPNGGTIFLPAAGYFWLNVHEDEGEGGFFWSSSLNPDDENYAYLGYFNFTSSIWDWDEADRSNGLSVRPVHP